MHAGCTLHPRWAGWDLIGSYPRIRSTAPQNPWNFRTVTPENDVTRCLVVWGSSLLKAGGAQAALKGYGRV